MKVNEIMTTQLVSAHPDTVVTKVSELFENNTFHHLPVLDENDVCLGVISKSDYYIIQDQMTKICKERAERSNQLLWRSLLASEIMTSPIISLDSGADISQAVDIFLQNQVHSIIITEENKCIGIVTTFDVIKTLQ